MGQRSYAGGAAASTLSSGIASGDTTFSVASATTWPSSGAFSIVIDRGLAGEEKVLVASRSGNTLTITTRGYDGTSAAAHSSGATVECCATATDFQEANDHIQATTGHGATGAVVGTTNSQTLTNKTLTAPTIADFTNAQHTHASAAQGGNIATPTGTVAAFAGSAAPSGWLLCDGAAVSRTTYAALFAVVSTTYGAGNGSTTFNVPDLRGRVPVQVDGGAGRVSANNTLGAASGSEAHTHTEGAHTHTSAGHTHGVTGTHTHTSAAHSHPLSSNGVANIASGAADGTLHLEQAAASFTATRKATGLGNAAAESVPFSVGTALAGSTDSASPGATGASSSGTTDSTTPGATGSNAGAGTGSTNSLPPYLVLNYIVKT